MFIFDIFTTLALTRTRSYNMFGHFKFCITLVGGYLLFHDPLSFNQVSLPDLRLILLSGWATGFALTSCLPVALRVWGSSALWLASCPTLTSSWRSRRRARTGWLRDRRPLHPSLARRRSQSLAAQCVEQLHTSLFIQSLFFFLHYDYFCRRISSWKGLNKNQIKKIKISTLHNVGTHKDSSSSHPQVGSEVDCFHLLNRKEKKNQLCGTTNPNNVCLFVMYILKTASDFASLSLSLRSDCLEDPHHN